MNIGILYPRSNTYPAISMDFIDALKACMESETGGQAIHFISESIGFGGTEKEVFEKAEKLLLIDKAELLIAYVDERVLQILKPLCLAWDKLMIVVNPGANYPDNWIPQPNIVYLSLQHSFLCWLSGVNAAATSSHAAVATSFYDCGYLHVAAFVNAFVRNGGQIAFNFVNKESYNHFSIAELDAFLSANRKVQTLLCLYDTLPASLFYSALNQLHYADKLHVFVSPMMLQEKALADLGNGFRFSVHGFAPWMASIINPVNQYFVSTVLEKLKRSATIFSLLGWECGLIIQQVLLLTDCSLSDGAAIAEQLARVKFEGPRGIMQMDESTHFFTAPVVECAVSANENKMHTTVIDFPGEQWKIFTAQRSSGVTSGWTNTYLCY